MKALSISRFSGLEPFQSIQAYYSIASRDIEREIVPVLKDQNVGLLVWSPLSGGFLSGKFTRQGVHDQSARRASFDFPPLDKEKAYDIIEVMDELAKDRGVSVAQIALAWLLHQDHVTSVIVGVRSFKQLDDNIQAVEIRLTGDELTRLDEVSRLPVEYPAWNQYPAWPSDRVPGDP